MKIAHFNTFSEGGAAIAARRIHHSLLNAQVNSKLIFLYPDRTKEVLSKNVRDFRNGISLTERLFRKALNKWKTTRQNNIIKAGGPVEELFSFFDSAWKVEHSADYKECDIVHFHWVSKFLNFHEFFRNNHKPVVFTLHDFFPFSGGFHYPQQNNILQDLQTKQHADWKRTTTNSNIHFVTPSAYLRKKILESGFAELENRITVIHNPVDSETFQIQEKKKSRNKLNLLPEEKYVLFVSDHIDYKRKGFDRLTGVIGKLKPGTKLLVAGKHPGRFSSHIKHPNVNWLGGIGDSHTMNTLFNSVDVVVVPSYQDNYPNVIIEANAAGVPVIGFPQGGISEMINHVNGILTRETDDLAEIINRAVEQNWNREEIRKNVLLRSDPVSVANQYLEVYKKLLS